MFNLVPLSSHQIDHLQIRQTKTDYETQKKIPDKVDSKKKLARSEAQVDITSALKDKVSVPRDKPVLSDKISALRDKLLILKDKLALKNIAPIFRDRVLILKAN